MGRKGLVLVLISLLMVTSIHLFSPIEAEDVFSDDNDIIIEGDNALILSEYFIGGSGIEKDPAVLSGFPKNTTSLKILNISSWIKIADQNFTGDHSKYLISLTNISGCYLENLSIVNREKLIFADVQTDIMILNSTLLCTQNDVEGIEMLKFNCEGNITIYNSFIKSNNSYYRTYMNNCWLLARTLSIHGSLINNANLISGRINGYGEDTFNLNGCQFQNGTNFYFNSKYPRSPNYISNCLFNDSAYDTRHNIDLHISNNTFQNGRAGLIFGWIDPHPHIKFPSEVRNNTFESCKGLDIVHGYYGSSKVMKNWNITENYFGNCSGPAIDWSENIEEVDDIHVWRNIFYHNCGTGDNLSSTLQVDVQYGWVSDTYFNFSKGKVGNYWRDHRSPDEDGNGIVDTPLIIRDYMGIRRNITDHYPVTNPYFDLTRPHLRITEPVNSTTDMEYTRIEWEAWDNETGLNRVLYSTDMENWTDVTNEQYWSMNLFPGDNTFYLKAYDNAGLFNLTSMTIQVDEISGPISLDAPEDGEILLDDRVQVNWTISEYFSLSKQQLKIDGKDVHTSMDDRKRLVTLSEGDHHASLTCWDKNNVNMTVEADFMVDTFRPDITIRSPLPDMIYNSELMNFQWSVYDHNEIVSMSFRLNDGPYENVDGTQYSFSRMIGWGDHRFEVRAEDIAGRTSGQVINFHILEKGMFITSPEDEFVTAENKVIVEWSIDKRFIPVKVLLLNLDMRSTTNVTERTSFEVNLTNEGQNRISITAFDEFGNPVTDWITVYRDIKPPLIQIMNTDAYTNLQPMIIRWYATDDHGVSRSQWRFDGGDRDETYGGIPQSVDLDVIEEGPHIFEIVCYDLAGNSANDSYEFTYDITPPIVTFSETEDPFIQKEPVLNLRWISMDTGGISNFTLMIGEYEIVLDNGISEWSGVLEDGHHQVKIIARDKAGNSANDTLEVIIDTSQPLIFWDEDNPVSTSSKEFVIGFWVDDNVGIKEVYLVQDEKPIWSRSGPGEFDVLVNTEEGVHNFTLVAIDITGRSARITCSTIVDLSPPELRSFSHSVEDGNDVIRWEVIDDLTGVDRAVISINGDMRSFNGPEGKWDLGMIEDGTHSFNITLIDNVGNSIQLSEEITIGTKAGEDGDQKERSYLWIIIAILIILLIAGIGVGSYVLRDRRKDGPEPDSEDRPSLIAPSTSPMLLAPSDNIKKPQLEETKVPTLGPAKLETVDMKDE